ncbi:putative reverse transcriptase domain-containing protein [Tanacetum coccineum]
MGITTGMAQLKEELMLWEEEMLARTLRHTSTFAHSTTVMLQFCLILYGGALYSNTFSALINITPITLESHYDVELADGKIIGVNAIIHGCTLNFINHPFNIDLMPVPLGSFDVIIGMDWLTKYHGVIICERENEEKRLEDVLIVRDFPDVFPEDLPGIPQPTKDLAEQLQALSDKGIIRPSSSPWGKKAPVLFFRIKDGSFPQGSEVSISKIDLTTSLPSVRVRRRHSLNAFRTRYGHYEFQRSAKLVGYYRRFIEGFSKIAKLMTKLTQKNVKFDWGEKEEAAFQLIKQKLCSAPILALPKGSENFIVYCDASHKGLGAVLMQNEKVIAYASRPEDPREKLHNS